jgi:hypothetical protein
VSFIGLSSICCKDIGRSRRSGNHLICRCTHDLQMGSHAGGRDDLGRGGDFAAVTLSLLIAWLIPMIARRRYRPLRLLAVFCRPQTLKGTIGPMDVAGLTFLALLLPFLGAIVAPLLTRILGHKAAWVLALVPVAIFLHFAGFAAELARGEVVTGGYVWVPSFNVSFSWLIDGLSLTFILLISGIGALIVL